MIITDKIEVEDRILASGGFADVRCGWYRGHLVAVKTMRVVEQDDFLMIRKVSISDIYSATWEAVLIIQSSGSVRKSSSGAQYLIRMS